MCSIYELLYLHNVKAILPSACALTVNHDLSYLRMRDYTTSRLNGNKPDRHAPSTIYTLASRLHKSYDHANYCVLK